MTEKRFINDVSEILDTWFGYMGEDEPTEREIKEKDYLLIGVARSQRDAENICEKLNEQNEELISYCNFSLHNLLDKKNKEIEQLKIKNINLIQISARNQVKNMFKLGNAHAKEIGKIEDEFDDEIIKLQKENEDLKHEINHLQDRLDDYILLEKEKKEFEEETGKLKKVIKLADDFISWNTTPTCQRNWVSAKKEFLK